MMHGRKNIKLQKKKYSWNIVVVVRQCRRPTFQFKLGVYHPGVFTELNNMVLSAKHTFILYFMHCLGCTQHWKPGTTFIPTTST